jgi:hypothetical protein
VSDDKVMSRFHRYRVTPNAIDAAGIATFPTLSSAPFTNTANPDCLSPFTGTCAMSTAKQKHRLSDAGPKSTHDAHALDATAVTAADGTPLTIPVVTASTGDVVSVTVTATFATSSFFHAPVACASSCPALLGGAAGTTTVTIGCCVSNVTRLSATYPGPASHPATYTFTPSGPGSVTACVYVLTPTPSRGMKVAALAPGNSTGTRDGTGPPSLDVTVTCNIALAILVDTSDAGCVTRTSSGRLMHRPPLVVASQP